ncbi:MAG TPA: hypothetical protein VNO30_46185 [Kofleriaceae bacterium]|nr:hypothetical protein [Kofleriaceae bacterium]
MARPGYLLLAVLAAGCPAAGDSDDYPIGGGGGGGGTSGPRADAGTGGDGGIDGQGTIRGRVCVVSDLRRLTSAVPGDCATMNAGGLSVRLGGSASVLTSADGSFTIPAQPGTNLSWRVSGQGFITSIVPVSTSALLPAIRESAYADLKGSNGIIVSPGQGSIVARVVRGTTTGTTAVTGATAQVTGGESLQTLYDGTSATVWATTATGALGVAWLPDNVAGARTLRVVVGTTQLSVPVAIVDQAITFVTISL